MSDEPQSTPDPDESTPTSPPEGSEDDHGAALDRASESISEARDAEGQVAAQDDITTLDDAHAGEDSEDPGGEGGHP